MAIQIDDFRSELKKREISSQEFLDFDTTKEMLRLNNYCLYKKMIEEDLGSFIWAPCDCLKISSVPPYSDFYLALLEDNTETQLDNMKKAYITIVKDYLNVKNKEHNYWQLKSEIFPEIARKDRAILCNKNIGIGENYKIFIKQNFFELGLGVQLYFENISNKPCEITDVAFLKSDVEKLNKVIINDLFVDIDQLIQTKYESLSKLVEVIWPRKATAKFLSTTYDDKSKLLQDQERWKGNDFLWALNIAEKNIKAGNINCPNYERARDNQEDYLVEVESFFEWAVNQDFFPERLFNIDLFRIMKYTNKYEESLDLSDHKYVKLPKDEADNIFQCAERSEVDIYLKIRTTALKHSFCDTHSMRKIAQKYSSADALLKNYVKLILFYPEYSSIMKSVVNICYFLNMGKVKAKKELDEYTKTLDEHCKAYLKVIRKKIYWKPNDYDCCGNYITQLHKDGEINNSINNSVLFEQTDIEKELGIYFCLDGQKQKITLDGVFVREEDLLKLREKCEKERHTLEKAISQGDINNATNEENASNNSEQYIFKKKGDGWFIKFKDTEVNIRNLIGFSYINYLLHRPNQSIPVEDLWMITHPPSPETIDSISDNQQLGNEMEYNIDGQPLPLTDKQTVADCKKDIKKIKKLIKEHEELILEAKESSDIEKEEELKEKIEKLNNKKSDLEQHLRSVTNKKGEIRQNSFSEKRRKNIGKAITYARKTIEKYCNKNKFDLELYDHLVTYIRPGIKCTYKPPNNFIWK